MRRRQMQRPRPLQLLCNELVLLSCFSWMDRESGVRGLHEPKRATLRFRGGVQASAKYRRVRSTGKSRQVQGSSKFYVSIFSFPSTPEGHSTRKPESVGRSVMGPRRSVGRSTALSDDVRMMSEMSC